MNSLKEKFDSFAPQPDKRVWQSISDTFSRRDLIRRRRIAASISLAVVAVGVAVFFVYGGHAAVSEGPQTASVSPVTVSPAVEELSSSPLVPSILPVGADANVAPSASADIVQLNTVDAVSDASSASASDSPVSAIDYVESAPVVSQSFQTPKPSPAAVSTPISVVSVPMSEESISSGNVAEAHVESPKINNSEKVTATESVVWVPNAFSPNDPDNPDVRLFKVYPSDAASINSYQIYVYSRGGRLVYHSRDINASWDGTSNGRALPMGTYVYVIEVNDAQKGLQYLKGTITLVR